MSIINGMAHLALSVSNFEDSKKFYKELLPYLGLKLVFDGEESVYHVGGRTALLIQKCDKEYTGDKFKQGTIGLHHLCFRAKSKEDVDLVAEKLLNMGAFIDRGPLEGPWVKGYYYIVFEDPDGIRLEVNYVPGTGVLDKKNKFDPSKDYK